MYRSFLLISEAQFKRHLLRLDWQASVDEVWYDPHVFLELSQYITRIMLGCLNDYRQPRLRRRWLIKHTRTRTRLPVPSKHFPEQEPFKLELTFIAISNKLQKCLHFSRYTRTTRLRNINVISNREKNYVFAFIKQNTAFVYSRERDLIV